MTFSQSQLICRFLRTTIIAASVTAVMWLTSTTAGQSLNIDFGAGHGAPAPTFAAAGLPGVWNSIDNPLPKNQWPPPPLRPVALIGLDGRPTNATLSVPDYVGGVTLSDIPVPHPELADDLQALLGDALVGAFSAKSPVDIVISGLEDGVYRLITYTWHWPAEEFAITTFVDEPPGQVIWAVGGPWPGGLTLGVTHMSNAFAISGGGELRFAVVGGGLGAFFCCTSMINGLQLWKIDESAACPADLSPSPGDGAVTGLDLAELLGQWGVCVGCLAPVTPPIPCPADLNSDCKVNGFDLAMLLAAWGPCSASPVQCGSDDLGDCYAVHGSGGCSESPCCAAICALDPYCCQQQWDAICVGLANLNDACAAATPPNCGIPEAGPCDQPGLTPGCADSACCATVCDIDSYCCQYGWDAICAAEAALYCSKIPPGCGQPAAGGCFDWAGLGNPTPFCDDAACCEAVCAIDDYCCTVQWDTVCVATAEAVCEKGSCGPGAGSCFTQHLATAGCDDSECCAAVCAFVPTCCDLESVPDGGWQAICVDWAEKLCTKTVK